MKKAIAYDLVRLALGPFSETPRGIDRVEIGCVTSLFESWPADCFGVLPTPWGVRWFPRERVLEGKQYLLNLWSEKENEEDRVYSRLAEALAADVAKPPEPSSFAVLSKTKRSSIRLRRFLKLIVGKRFSFGYPTSSLPKGAVYVNLGHYGLAYPRLLSWLIRRPDISRFFMLHDAIPVQRPDLVATSTVQSYRSALISTTRFADRIVVPSNASKTAVESELTRMHSHAISVEVVRLPVDDVFRHKAPLRSIISKRPYFVVVGAIEPRKNQSLLFEVWKILIARLGDLVPNLVVAGPLGHNAQGILKIIDSEKRLARHVLITPGLSRHSLAKVIAGSRALLMPSLAEGFGLPPAEALSLGVPAIVSDIPAHHEAAGSHALFVDPHSVGEWTEAIFTMCTDSAFDQNLRDRAATFQPRSWQTYMRLMGDLIQSTEPAVR